MLLFLHYLLVLCLLTAAAVSSPRTLNIAAFNVQVFGKSKMSKEAVVPVLVKMLQRWDLVLVQEVRDASGDAIQELLTKLNAAASTCTGNSNPYALFLSERLGRTSSKEQLAWFYRSDRITKVDAQQWEDPLDHWERPPQVTYWDLVGKGKAEDVIGIIGIHIDPDEAVKEIDALAPVVDAVVATGKAKAGVFVAGDLNADCSYVTKTEWKCIREASCTDTTMRLYNPDKYKWLISDSADTTVKSTDCAYDRFVFNLPVPSQVSAVEVYNFGATMGLTANEMAAVSDHFPIEFTWTWEEEADNDGGGGGGGDEQSKTPASAATNGTENGESPKMTGSGELAQRMSSLVVFITMVVVVAASFT